MLRGRFPGHCFGQADRLRPVFGGPHTEFTAQPAALPVVFVAARSSVSRRDTGV
jgi:hypothetical protein